MNRIISANEQHSSETRTKASFDRCLDGLRQFPSTAISSEGQPDELNSSLYDDEDSLVRDLNERHAIIMTGGKSTYLLQNSNELKFFTKQAIADFLAPYQLLKGTGKDQKVVPGFDTWLKSPRRRIYENGMVFEPNTSVPGALNLWRGFAIKPKPGDYTLFKEHLFRVVCKSDLENYNFLFSWLAQIVQEPGRKSGTAVVLRGQKGTGKSTVSQWLKAMVGRHAKIVDRSEMFTGKFNAHLMDCLILLVEEGFWAGNKQAESVLKHLVTGTEMMMERKGIDAVQVSNHVRVFMTTNNKWVVPATEDERRFFVLDVSSERAKDNDYFSALDHEFNNGGPAALLDDLLKHDYSMTNLRNPPRTQALQEQIEQTLPAEVQWWQSVLEEGVFFDKDGNSLDGDKDWNGQIEIEKAFVFQSFTAYVDAPRGRAITTGVVGKFVREMVPNVVERRLGGRDRQDRPRAYVFPPLAELRAAFTQRYGVAFGDPVAALAGGIPPKMPTPVAISSAKH